MFTFLFVWFGCSILSLVLLFSVDFVTYDRTKFLSYWKYLKAQEIKGFLSAFFLFFTGPLFLVLIVVLAFQSLNKYIGNKTIGNVLDRK